MPLDSLSRLRIDIRSEVRAEIPALIALIDPSLTTIVKYSCLSCIGLLHPFSASPLPRFTRQVLLDMHALYSSFTPWLIIDEQALGKTSCPIIRGSRCRHIDVETGDSKLRIRVDCDELGYECILSI